MPAYWIHFSYVRIRWLKRYSVRGPLAVFGKGQHGNKLLKLFRHWTNCLGNVILRYLSILNLGGHLTRRNTIKLLNNFGRRQQRE